MSGVPVSPTRPVFASTGRESTGRNSTGRNSTGGNSTGGNSTGPIGASDRGSGGEPAPGANGLSQLENRRAFIALGSNLGDRWAYLRTGLGHLPDLVAVSPVYETAPVGGPPGQDWYLNAVAELWTAATPLDLLNVARRAEAAAGRERAQRWGARALDIDVLLVGGLTVDLPDLQVPHPRMWERGFVLVPLADLAPEIVGTRLTDDMRAGVNLAGNLQLDGAWSLGPK